MGAPTPNRSAADVRLESVTSRVCMAWSRPSASTATVVSTTTLEAATLIEMRSHGRLRSEARLTMKLLWLKFDSSVAIVSWKLIRYSAT